MQAYHLMMPTLTILFTKIQGYAFLSLENCSLLWLVALFSSENPSEGINLQIRYSHNPYYFPLHHDEWNTRPSDYIQIH